MILDCTPDPAHQLDLAVLAAAPLAAVPAHARFAPLPAERSSHRYLVARDGLWLEVRRPWLHFLWPLAEVPASVTFAEALSTLRTQPAAPADDPVQHLVNTAPAQPNEHHIQHVLPYGRLERRVDLAFGRVPRDFIRAFAAAATDHLPMEAGAWVEWEYGRTSVDRALPGRLVWSETADEGTGLGEAQPYLAIGTPASLTYERPPSLPHYEPCIDLHSHGVTPAFFSGTDDADDRHDVKIAIVVGNLDQRVPTIYARLCVMGIFLPIPVRAAEVFEGWR